MGVMYRAPLTYEEILHEDYHEGDGEACRAFNPHDNTRQQIGTFSQGFAWQYVILPNFGALNSNLQFIFLYHVRFSRPRCQIKIQVCCDISSSMKTFPKGTNSVFSGFEIEMLVFYVRKAALSKPPI